MSAASPISIFPESFADEEQFSREEQAAALVKAFFHIVREWELGAEQARALLGSPSKSRFYDLRKGQQGAVRALSEDEMDRLAYITGIYYGLGILYSPENSRNWLRNEADPEQPDARPWGAAAPLAHMAGGKMEALIDVYRYVQGLRGGL